MAGSLSNLGAALALDHFTGTTESVFVGQYYVAAMTTVPVEAGTGGVEASGGSYARQAIDFDAATTADPSVTANSNTVEFPTGWTGTVEGLCICNHVSNSIATTAIWIMTLTANKTIGATDVFRLAIGAVDLTVD